MISDHGCSFGGQTHRPWKMLVNAGILCGTLLVAAHLASAQYTGPLPVQNTVSEIPPNQIGPSYGNPAGYSNSYDHGYVQRQLREQMAQIQFGQLAAQKGTSSDVRELGRHLAVEHKRLEVQFEQLAGNAGDKRPTELSSRNKKTLAQLESLSGDQFDHAYLTVIRKSQRSELADLRIELLQGEVTQVREMATTEKPLLRQKLSEIDQIAKSHNL